MSHKSQERNMRKLAELLSQDLGYIWGEKESGPNGAKKQETRVRANAGGIGVSGACTLMGMWHTNGLYVNLSQFCSGGDSVLLYRAIRHSKDYTGGYNIFLTLRELAEMDYTDLLFKLAALREEDTHERAA